MEFFFGPNDQIEMAQYLLGCSGNLCDDEAMKRVSPSPTTSNPTVRGGSRYPAPVFLRILQRFGERRRVYWVKKDECR